MLMAAVELCIVSCLQYHHHFHNVVFLINVSNPIDATRRLLSSSKSAIKLNLIKVLCRIFFFFYNNFCTVFFWGDENIFIFLSRQNHTTSRLCVYFHSRECRNIQNCNFKNRKKSFCLSYLTDLWESLAIISWC